MSIQAYLKLLPLAWKNREKVAEGVINKIKDKLGTLPEDEQAEIIRRHLICEECPFMSENSKKLSDYESGRIDEHCTLCQCNISLKVSSLSSSCGIATWNDQHPNDPMPLKWKAFKTT